jgi:hypothetical protein
MTTWDEVRKTLEAVIAQLSPAKAQETAKRYVEPGAAKEQVAKTASELIQLSRRLREVVRKEVSAQLKAMGAATQDDLDALRKRVRDLERAAGMTASGRKAAARTPRARTTASPRSRSATTRSSAARKSSPK